MERKKYSRVVDGWKGRWWDAPKHTPQALAEGQKWLNFIKGETDQATRMIYAQRFILNSDAPDPNEMQQKIEQRGGYDALEKLVRESREFKALQAQHKKERVPLALSLSALYASEQSDEPEIVETAKALTHDEFVKFGHNRLNQMSPLDRRILELKASVGGQRNHRYIVIARYLVKSPRLVEERLEHIDKIVSSPIL